jgi:hypothetical protein
MKSPCSVLKFILKVTMVDSGYTSNSYFMKNINHFRCSISINLLTICIEMYEKLFIF